MADRRQGPAPIEYRWIDEQDDLDSVVALLAGQARYALDTEFHRERTYYPKLALIQVAWAGEQGQQIEQLGTLVIEQLGIVLENLFLQAGLTLIIGGRPGSFLAYLDHHSSPGHSQPAQTQLINHQYHATQDHALYQQQAEFQGGIDVTKQHGNDRSEWHPDKQLARQPCQERTPSGLTVVEH